MVSHRLADDDEEATGDLDVQLTPRQHVKAASHHLGAALGALSDAGADEDDLDECREKFMAAHEAAKRALGAGRLRRGDYEEADEDEDESRRVRMESRRRESLREGSRTRARLTFIRPW